MPGFQFRIRSTVAAACLTLVAIATALPIARSTAQPNQRESPSKSIALNANADWPASVLLITNKALAEAWLPFAEHKTKLGKRTEIVTVNDIWEQYRGADMQARIKACITDFVDNRETRWVVLGGDSDGDAGVVPDRDTNHPRFEWADVPTDLWYVSVKDWEVNDDGAIGTWGEDRAEISYETRAAIGRIPVRTADDVATFTDKVIAYETKYPTAKYATELVVTCTEERGYARVDNMWAIINDQWTGALSKYFTDQTPWDGRTAGDFSLSPDNVIAQMTKQVASKWHMIGHGNANAWVLEGGALTAARTTEIENTAPLLITTVSCHTGRFDGEREPCAAEGMLRGAGGAVMVIAPARQGLSAPSVAGEEDDDAPIDGLNLLYTRFWQYGLDGSGLTVGEAFAKARVAVAPDTTGRRGVKDHFTLCEVNLLGDPTLDFRATDPIELRIGGQREVDYGVRIVRVTTNAPGATVCVWQDGHAYATETADANGNAIVHVSGLEVGKAWVTVCGPNINAVSREIDVK